MFLLRGYCQWIATEKGDVLVSTTLASQDVIGVRLDLNTKRAVEFGRSGCVRWILAEPSIGVLIEIDNGPGDRLVSIRYDTDHPPGIHHGF